MKKILVVDDDPEIRDILTALLSPEGFQVFWAKNGREFELLALRENPDLILLDIMLGRENGPMLYSHLLAQGLDRNIPVIFLSGLAAGTVPNRLQPGRSYTMHPKPFQCDDLLRDIRTLTAAA